MVKYRHGLSERLFSACVLAAVGLVFAVGAAKAALIEPGTQTTAVPATLDDPFATLAQPLPAGQFLLPIEISGAIGLQNWSFDLAFDGSVVSPLDVGGLYQSVYQAEFNAADLSLSEITSAGFVLPGVLEGIAGFSSGVSGDGLLAFVLFEYVPGQEGADPGFQIENPVAVEQVPEPGTMLLTAVAALAFGLTRVRDGRLSSRQRQ